MKREWSNCSWTVSVLIGCPAIQGNAWRDQALFPLSLHNTESGEAWGLRHEFPEFEKIAQLSLENMQLPATMAVGPGRVTFGSMMQWRLGSHHRIEESSSKMTAIGNKEACTSEGKSTPVAPWHPDAQGSSEVKQINNNKCNLSSINSEAGCCGVTSFCWGTDELET